MKVVVTGPTGSIGSELVGELISEGHEVTAIVRPGSNRLDNIPKSDLVSVIECDISNYKSLYGRGKCDLFFHLAWEGTTVLSRNDAAIQSKNIQYALDATSLAKDWGARRFIGTGSQAEYGPSDTPLSSTTPIRPISAYGVAKYAAGRLCGLYCKDNGMEFSWARILSAYGKNDADNTLIMYLIRTLKKGEIPRLTKCEQTWDYIYSKDCAKALVAICYKGEDGKTYCIGNGSKIPLKDYVEEIKMQINPKIEISYGALAYYPDQPMMLCADISELTKDTDFVPQTSFRNGIKQIIGWLYPNDSANE
jgi:nucleoside-diphosphate-sugar epimerase